MDLIAQALRDAFALLIGGDSAVYSAAWRSLWISGSAVLLASAVAIPLGVTCAIHRFPGRRIVVGLGRAGMALPTVVLGLLGYAFLRRDGPLGDLGLLYTPTAIVIGEMLLAAPIVFSLTHGAVGALDPRADETIRTLGASRVRRYVTLVSEARTGVLLGIMTALARCITELGIAILVGGNLLRRTRTLPTATALETSRGEFERGMAMGMVLLLLAMGLFLGMALLTRERRGGVER